MLNDILQEIDREVERCENLIDDTNETVWMARIQGMLWVRRIIEQQDARQYNNPLNADTDWVVPHRWGTKQFVDHILNFMRHKSVRVNFTLGRMSGSDRGRTRNRRAWRQTISSANLYDRRRGFAATVLRKSFSSKEKQIWVIRGKKIKAKGNNRKRPTLVQRKNENWKKKRRNNCPVLSGDPKSSTEDLCQLLEETIQTVVNGGLTNGWTRREETRAFIVKVNASLKGIGPAGYPSRYFYQTFGLCIVVPGIGSGNWDAPRTPFLIRFVKSAYLRSSLEGWVFPGVINPIFFLCCSLTKRRDSAKSLSFYMVYP